MAVGNELNHVLNGATVQGGLDVQGQITLNGTRVSGSDIINVADYGAVRDGVTDDTGAIVRAIRAAQGQPFVGAYRPIYFPPGKYRTTQTITFTDGSTILGAGARPAGTGANPTKGGSEIFYDGSDTTAHGVVLGEVGADWSRSTFDGFYFTRAAGGTTGRALVVYNPTNNSKVQNVHASGWPDGQILVDDSTGGGGNPGPNFFRLSNFFVTGGVVPLEVQGGRQQMLIDYGGIDTTASSVCGFKMSGGEAQAFVVNMQSVKCEGSVDVPGFWSAGNGSVVFTGCIRSNYALTGTAAGFLFDYPTNVTANFVMIACSSYGTTLAFSAPGLTASITTSASVQRFLSHVLCANSRGNMIFPNSSVNTDLVIHKDVKLAWTDSAGDGPTTDTNLYRSAANVLKTDDTLHAALGVATFTKAGTPSDADWAVAPPVGTLVVDTSASKLWARTAAATWKGVAIA